jgi:hypothetical protein
MSIRQTNHTGQAISGDSAADCQVAVDVKEVHEPIGTTWYHPAVKVANKCGSPITVTDIELSAHGRTYARDSNILNGPPTTIQIGNSATVGVGFRLDASVYEVFFRHPAELLVHYQVGAEQKTARVTIVGAHLDGSR